ncbi:MAG: hypothetical protein RL514_84 [Verrucomicrobiota bacterium]
MPTHRDFGTNCTVFARLAKLTLTLLFLGSIAPVCFAPDSVTMRILTDTGSRTALLDPMTFNAGTIKQGLTSLGFTDPTPRQERFAIDNKANPATLESMTVATWPLLPGLTAKSAVAPSQGNYYAFNRQDPVHYFANVEEPNVQRAPLVRPVFQATEHTTSRATPPGIRPPGRKDGYAWFPPETSGIEKPRFERPAYDYSGPPFLFSLPPEMLKNPLIANDPNMLRLFVKTNEAGARAAKDAVNATRHIRRMRPASFWDNVEAPNNPRADYADGTDYETQARNASKVLTDLRDPSLPPVNPNDPRPSFDSRPGYNPQRQR